MSAFYSQSGGWGLIRETNLPMQEFELKMQGGGVIAGSYGNNNHIEGVPVLYVGQKL